MKQIFSLAMILMFLGISTLAAAESLEFVWSYDTPTTNLVGFRLYRDGTVLDTDKIPPAARTIKVPRQTDKKSHTYHLTAYSVDNESGPSNTAIDAYISAAVSPVGNLQIKVVQ